MAKFRTLYRYKQDYLTGKGFLPFESRELARQYTMRQLRSLQYLKSIIRTRGLYISGLRKRGYTDRAIIKKLRTLYDRKDWKRDGKPDIWRAVKDYRKKSIDRGEYTPPKRKGSHHPPKSGISKGQIAEQKKRREKRMKELRQADRVLGF